jgi:phosphatidylserine/phosphatidylglycerophosphate/cardiolipin synthase-like enzyme
MITKTTSTTRRRWLITLTITAVIGLLLFLTVHLLAQSGPPAWYFTDNIESEGPSPEITTMEAALLSRIDTASSRIDVSIYDFNRDSIRDGLIAAHNRGVQVRVVTDDQARDHPTYSLYFDALEAAGIPVVDDDRPGSIMHNKFFVFDETVIWTGSTNITDRGFTVNHNNSLVLTSTLLADIYAIEFEQMFAGSFSNAKSEIVTTTLDYNGRPLQVYFSPKGNAIDPIITEVAAAEDSIYFSIFFFTSSDLAQAMIERRQAGLEIRGVWDLLGAASPFSQDEALCDGGIPIKIENFYGFMHNKFMVIDAGGDNPRVVTGSMNWTGAGNNSNDENTLIIHDGDVAQAYLDAFQVLYDALDEDTLCDYAVIEVEYYVWLPAIVSPPAPPTPTPTPSATPLPQPSPSPTPTPTPEPIDGDNLVCQTWDNVQLCGWVSDGTPPQFSTVTVYGRLLVDGVGQAGQLMETAWHYSSTTSYCDGITGSNGVAQCSRGISGATIGFQVNVDVEIDGYQVTTWFTPE